MCVCVCVCVCGTCQSRFQCGSHKAVTTADCIERKMGLEASTSEILFWQLEILRGPIERKQTYITKPKNSNEPTRNRGLPGCHRPTVPHTPSLRSKQCRGCTVVYTGCQSGTTECSIAMSLHRCGGSGPISYGVVTPSRSMAQPSGRGIRRGNILKSNQLELPNLNT